jgi:hypothetical protein
MCDVKLILGLPCILPSLECVHMLIKITQGKDVFVCDFVNLSIKLVQHKFSKLYYNPCTRFDDPSLDDFNIIKTLINDTLFMSWFSNFNCGNDAMYLAFLFIGHNYHIY